MKKLLIMTVLIIATAALVFASGKTETGTTAAKGPVTMTFVAPVWDVNPPMNDWWIWKAYEKMSKIHIIWNEIPRASLDEKKNLMFASADLPDAFWQVPFTTADIASYGEQGLLVALDTDNLLEKNAPSLSAVMNRLPSVRAVITMPDGHIYSLPYIMEDGNDASLRYYINKNWMQRVGITKRPETTEELYTLLKAFKDKDANGNGNPNDEIPLYMSPGGFPWTFERQLFGAFGVGGHGLPASSAFIYLNSQTGKIEHVYASQGGKELWQYEARLWKDGLIHPETFTGYEYAKWVADGQKDIVGMYSWVGPNFLGEDVQDNFIGVTQIAGPKGNRDLTWIDPPARGNWSFLITNKCKTVPEAIKWADYFYSPEGAKFGFIGIEGETYKMVNGKPEYIDEILNYKGGVQLGAFQYGLLVYGGYYPYIEPSSDLIAQVKGMSKEEVINCDPEEYKKYMPKEIWPTFSPTKAELEVLVTVETDINTYINESRVKFVTGAWNFVSDWDNYIAQLKKMGLDKLVGVRQQQYDRYKKTQK